MSSRTRARSATPSSRARPARKWPLEPRLYHIALTHKQRTGRSQRSGPFSCFKQAHARHPHARATYTATCNRAPGREPKNEPARQRSRSTRLKQHPSQNVKAPVQGGCTGAHVATGLKRRQEGEHGSGQVTLTTTESGESHVEEQRRMLRLILIRSDGNDLLGTCLFKRLLREINRGGQHNHVSVLHVIYGLAD